MTQEMWTQALPTNTPRCGFVYTAMMPGRMSEGRGLCRSSLEGGCHRAKVAVAAQHDGDVVAGAADGRVHAALQAQQVRQRVVQPDSRLRSTCAAQKACRLTETLLKVEFSLVSRRNSLS